MNATAAVELAFEVGGALARLVLDAVHRNDGAALRRLADVCPVPLQSRLKLEAIKAEAVAAAKEP